MYRVEFIFTQSDSSPENLTGTWSEIYTKLPRSTEKLGRCHVCEMVIVPWQRTQFSKIKRTLSHGHTLSEVRKVFAHPFKK